MAEVGPVDLAANNREREREKVGERESRPEVTSICHGAEVSTKWYENRGHNARHLLEIIAPEQRSI